MLCFCLFLCLHNRSFQEAMGNYLRDDECKQLQSLLRRARDAGRIGELCMLARVSGDEISAQQRELVESGRVMTEPTSQFPWTPQAKSKAKTAPPASSSLETMGAMTDASKRRFEETPDIDEELAEFEMIRSIEEFNMTGGGSYADALPMSSTPIQVAEAATTGPPLPRAHRKFVVQGNNVPLDPSDTWCPEVDQALQDALVTTPHGVTSPSMWGRTILTMPKFRGRNISYEQALRMALGGHGEMVDYLGFIHTKYSKGYQLRGSKTQAEDLAGYLCRYRFKIVKEAVYAPGFQRELQ